MRCCVTLNILEIMRLSEKGLTQRAIAASINCGKTTVCDVQKKCQGAGLTYAKAREMTNAEITGALYPAMGMRAEKTPPDWEAVHKWLKSGKRRNLQYAWEEYRQNCPEGLGYSQFCRRYGAWKGSTGKNVTMVQNHKPGDKMFLDWVGDTLDCVTAPDTGETWKAHFFVAVLGYSDYPYAEAFPNEKEESWLAANIHALEHFRGVPNVGVPDNTTTAVTKPHYYEPKLNPTYADFARHYGIAIVPARPYRPKDKSLAEGGVGWLETWLLEWLRGQRFFGFAELNRAIRQRMEALVRRPFQKRPGTRLSEYEEFDLPALRPLPPTRFEVALYATRRVPDSYHVEYDGYYYSVPYALHAQTVTIRATPTMIEIIDSNRERVALFERKCGGPRYATDPEHMPEKHRRQAKASSRTGEDYLKLAEALGSNTRAVIGRILKAQDFEQTAYRSCMGVIQFAKKHGAEQLEAACGRALDVGSPCYTTVKNLLQNPTPPAKRTKPLPTHENLRSPAEFA